MSNTLKLFTKTWVNDYPWLKLAMKSVLKLSKDVVDWTIIGDEGSRTDLEAVVHQAVQESKGVLKYRIIEVPELWPEATHIGNGYLSQQWVKMTAHKAIPQGYFLNWDSDVIATKKFSSQDFIGKSGRPVYWFSQFNALMTGADKPAHEQRMQMMREVLQLPLISFEWMRCMPIWLNGQILSHASGQPEWNRAFEMMKRGDHRISEFNIIGQFCHLYYPDAFEWKNAENAGPTWAGGYVEGGRGSGSFQEHAIVAQGWSWGGIPKPISEFVNGL
jgi:hypothetical protein